MPATVKNCLTSARNYRTCKAGGGGEVGVEIKYRIICLDLDSFIFIVIKEPGTLFIGSYLSCNSKCLFAHSSSPLLPSPTKAQVSSLAPYSRTPSASLSVRPCFTPMSSNRKILVLYTLTFVFSDSTRDDRTFWTECLQAFPD